MDQLKKNTSSISDEIKEIFNNIIPDKDDQIGWHDFFYDLNNGGIDDFIDKHKIADENFRQFLNTIGNAKFDMADYQQWLFKNSKATNTFASITRQTENVLKSFGSSLGDIAINLIVDEIIGELNRMANAEKEATERTKELYNESNMGTQRYKETINALNDIIEKYINTQESDSLDSEKGMQLVQLQNDINALIGQEANSIDLVNGKVDEQLEKLKQISKERKQAAYYNSIGNYNNAKNAANTAREQEEDDGSDYIYRERSIDEDTLNILEKAGFKFRKTETNMLKELFNWSSNGFIQVDADQDENGKPLRTLKEKTDYLKRMQQTLLSNNKGNSGIYTAITRQIETWSEITGKQQNSAEDLVYFYLDFAADSSNIHSTNDFKEYRNRLIETTKENPDIARVLSDGMLNEKDLVTIIDSYMISTEGFSDWFIKWKNSFKDQIDNTSISSPISFTKSWKNIGATGTDEENKRNEEEKRKLLKLAEAGKLTKEEFENSPIAQTIFKETGLSAEQATQEVNNLIENVKQLKAMESGISAITSAYDEKKSSKTHTISQPTLDSMYDTLGVDEWDDKNKEVWKNYKKCAVNGKASMGSLKKAQDELATSFVNSNNFLAQLDDTNDDHYKTLLTQMGVENADTIVTNELAEKKGLAAIETAALSNMTSDEIQKLIQEKGKTDNARNAMKLFALEKVYANGEALDTTEDINQLINLIDSFGLTSDAIKEYRDYLSGDYSGSDNPGDGLVLAYNANKEFQKIRKKLEKKTNVQTKNKDSSDNSDKNKTEETKTEIDWLSRRLTRMQSIIDLTASKLQNLFSVKAKNSNLNKQIKETTALMNQYGIAAKRYQKKADSIAKGTTTTVKSGKNKGKKKKEKPLSKDIINKVKSGKITKSSYGKLVKEYGQNKANRINKYIDYYDKAQDAKKNKQDMKAKARELKKQKLQNWVDLYDSRTARAEAKESIQTTAKGKEDAIETQIKNIKRSYKYQIKIANLSKNKAEADRLEYEKQQKIKELKEKQLQNYVDEYNTSADLAETRSGNAVGYEEQNSYISTQLSWLKKSYDKQIEIAALNGDITEQDRLQAEYKAKEVDLKQQQIDNLKNDYENRIGLINNDKQDISNSLAETEARGDIVQASFYSSLNSYEEKVLADLREEREKLQAQQDTFDKYSPKWYDLQSDIQSVENSISEANQSIIENNKKIGELRQAMYDDIASRNSDASSEAQFLAGLLGNNLTDDKTGSLTKEGLGVLGTYGIELEANTNTVRARQTERKEIEDAIARYNSGDVNALSMYGSLHAAKEALADVIKKQQEAISAEYSSMKDIYDIMVQKYEAQLAYMKSIIDAKKQVLNMEKDLYDYQKNIANQTKNIAALEKQLTALKGDDSEEGRARRAKLQVSLDEANQNLQDTEYERYISDQENMLDNMYNQYEDLLCALEKDFETVVKDGVELINKTSGGISQILNDYAKDYGYNPSSDMQEILNCMKIYETDDAGNVLVKTLPNTIKDGLSALGNQFNTLADEIRKSYTGGNGGSGGSGSGGSGYGGSGSGGNGGSGGNSDLGISTEELEHYHDRFETGNFVEIQSDQEEALRKELAENSGGKTEPLRPVKEGETEDSFSSELNKKLFHYGYIVKSGAKENGLKYIDLFAQRLGLNWGYDGSFAADGKVYTTLAQKYPYLGFRTGGIVRADGVPKDGDNVLVRVNPNETVLTQDFTKLLPDSVDTMRHFVNVTDYSKLMKSKANGNNFGNIIVTAELPNVANAQDFVSEFQNSKRIQKAFEIGVRDCLSHGRITNNIQNII